MENKLTTTREDILAIARSHPESKKGLAKLFPGVFEDSKILCEIGTVMIRLDRPGNFYALIKWNGEVRFLNITHNSFWDSKRNIKVSALSDSTGRTITIGEFKALTGMADAHNAFAGVRSSIISDTFKKL